MPNLTLKQEAFVMAYAETGNATEAYRRAYNAENMKPETIHVKACELLKSGKVAVMVAELQAEHAARHAVTVDSITEEAMEVFRGAMEANQFGAAKGALDLKAKLHGLLIDRMKVDAVTKVNVVKNYGA